MTIIVLGGINEDIVLSVDALPRPGETIAATGIAKGAGGKGLNQAIAAARQGSTVHMLGAVGDDAPGAMLLDVMARNGVGTGHIAVMPDQRTGQALVTLARTGENMIVVHAGANAAYGTAEVAFPAAEARIFLTQFEATLEAIEALFTTPEAESGIRILNTAPALEEGRSLLPLADILVLNETELAVFADLPHPPQDEKDIVEAARRLLLRADQHVIVTLGAKGCLCVSAEASIMIPGLRMNAIDTIGAGDCFCGVLAAELERGATLEAAILHANAAAAISVTRSGAGEAAPSRDEVDAILAAAVRP